LALWAIAEFCWKNHFWAVKTVVVRGVTALCSTSSWYTWAPVFTAFSQKWRRVTPWWDISHQTMTEEERWPPAASERTSRDFGA
jgi:hypothetical protein